MVFRFETEDWWLRGSVCVCVFLLEEGKMEEKRDRSKKQEAFFCEIERRLRSYIRGSVDGFTAFVLD
jgi:hypothetical protein